MAKRKNKTAGKKAGTGCGTLVVGLFIAFAVLANGGKQGAPTSSDTTRPTSTTRSQALVSQNNTSAKVSNPSGRNTSAQQVTNPTRTPQPAKTSPPTRIPSAPTEDYTATGNANVRSCPKTTCDIVRGVSLGERLTKIGEAQGDSVNGSSVWYEIRLATGATGFIHSGLARAGTPRPAPVAPVVVQPRATTAGNALVATSVVATNAATSQPDEPDILPTIPQSTAAPPQFTCGGDYYNCSDFRNRAELMTYFNACPGDPSKLDGNNDGVPCESLR